MDKPLVSICCLAYNHEKYIIDAIESFLNQKTDFRFEILIHDDASTDNTPEIIKRYEQQYPDIIKPVYQTSNKYSQGDKMFYQHCFLRAKGEYLALCEGDDFWTDVQKLQKQVDYLRMHPECSLVTHAGELVNHDKAPIRLITASKENRYFGVEEIIRGGGGLFVTNSMVFPRSLINEMPEFYFFGNIEDYPLTMLLSLQGQVYYLTDVMSAYRTNVKGSWMDTVFNSPDKKEKISQLNQTVKNMLLSVNDHTKNRFEPTIIETIRAFEFQNLLVCGDRKAMISPEYLPMYRKLSLKKKLIIILRDKSPLIYDFMQRVKKGIKCQN